jgi:dienelactone hydrolase
MKKNILLIGCIMSHCGYSLFGNDVVYLFSHGLYANSSLAYYYENIRKPSEIINNGTIILTGNKAAGVHHSWSFEDENDARLWIIQQPLHTFNYPDAQYGFDPNKTSLGQENEIATLAYANGKIKKNKTVIMGMSRGASTILNFLGTKQPTNVVAAVVESPFDSVINTLDTHCNQFWLRFVPSLVYTSPNVLFGRFNPNGISPIKVVDNIAKELPVLIIASLKDALIPAANSASIYQKLIETGHGHVYLLLLDHGEHAYLLEDIDADIYLNTVHAFYEKYNLPYNKALAAKGRVLLAQCQPSAAILADAIKNKKSYIQR